MQASVRPYVATGVALVAASAIAVTPIAPPLNNIEIHNPPVQLTQMASPLQAYVQVFQESLANVETLLNTFAANPTPILSQVLANQVTNFESLVMTLQTVLTTPLPETLQNLVAGFQNLVSTIQDVVTAIPGNLTKNLQTLVSALQTALPTVPPLLEQALTDLAHLDVEDAVNNLLLATATPLIPFANSLATTLQDLGGATTEIGGALPVPLSLPVQNLGKAINALGANLVLGLGTGLAGPLISGVGALGAAAQGVIDVVRGGNLLGTLDAVVTGPAVIADGVLNGGFGPNLASLEGIDPSELIALSGGLLNQGALLSLAPLTILAPGTIASLQFVQQQIATAIDPPPAKRAPVLNSPGAVPNLAANTVAVNTPITKPGQRLAKIVGGLENAVGTTTAAATGVAGSGKTTAGNSTKPGAGLAKIATGLAKALTGGSKPSVGNGAKAGGPLGKIASALNGGPRHKRAAAN